MQIKPLLFAATAAAFLVVPEVSEADEDIISILPFELETPQVPAIATAQSVGVPCQQCYGKDTQLLMDFVIEDGSRLLLNDFELYPTADPWHGDLSAGITTSNGKEKAATLGYSLSVKPEAVDMEQHLELVNVQLRVIEVGGLFVDGVPTVKVMLIKAPSGELLIGSVEVEEAAEKDVVDGPLLRIKEKIKKFFNHIKSGIKGGCHRHGKANANAEEVDPEEFSGKNPHHGARPWRPHGHHHGRHGHNWAKLIKNIAHNILLPVLTGITAGVVVAVFAMGLCSCLALVFRARRRRSRRAQRQLCSRHARQVKAAASEPAVEEEKAGLMDAEDLPPYENDEPTQ